MKREKRGWEVKVEGRRRKIKEGGLENSFERKKEKV